MDKTSHMVSFVVSSDSEKKLEEAKEMAVEKVRLDRIYTSDAVAFPGGKETHWVTEYKFGDIFDRIEIVNQEKTFLVNFYIKSNAPSFYKDLIVVGVLKPIWKPGVVFQLAKQ